MRARQLGSRNADPATRTASLATGAGAGREVVPGWSPALEEDGSPAVEEDGAWGMNGPERDVAFDPGAELGPRLRRVREERGLSVRELARRISCSPSLISQIERGLSAPSVGILYAIATELRASLDFLFGAVAGGDAMLATAKGEGRLGGGGAGPDRAGPGGAGSGEGHGWA